jgi:mannosylglucosylglycerate synthase
MNVAILHYTCWPVISGVESVMRQHACLMQENGHLPTILSGRGKAFSAKVPTQIIPELNELEPCVAAAQQEVFNGGTGENFHRLTDRLRRRLEPTLSKCDSIVVHNVLTMPFNMAATQVLSELARRGRPIVAWTHDLAAMNPDYSVPRHRIFDLIRERQTNIRYVTVSKTRAEEFRNLTGTEPDAIVPNGIDLPRLLDISPEIEELLCDAASSTVFLYPTRILQRKNLAFAFQILAALRGLGTPAQLFVTAAPDAHDQAPTGLLTDLKKRADELHLAEHVVWVNEHFFVDDRQLRSLYLMADALLYTTRQEGFGLPLHEAAAFRVPIFCSNIEALRSHLPENAVAFDLRNAPGDIAEKIRITLDQDKAFLSRKQVLGDYSAKRLYRERIEPFLWRQP